MRIWLIKIGIRALRQGNIMVFLKMLFLLFVAFFAVVSEGFSYFLLGLNRRQKHLLVNGFKMLTLSGDRGISRELAVYKIREKFTTDYIRSLVGKKMTIIDIGANIGYYALLEANLARKGVVYAFEPDRGNYQILQRNILLNKLQNIVLLPLAVADSVGEKEFYLYPKRNWSSFNSQIGVSFFDKIKVKTTSLDAFWQKIGQRQIDLVRMDVEGYEGQIIKGAEKLLNQSKHLTLVIEVHPHLVSRARLKKMLDNICRAGFSVDAVILEIQPRYLRYLRYFNSFRQDVGLLPFGKLSKEFSNFDSLEKILIKMSQGFYYYPCVVFKK